MPLLATRSLFEPVVGAEQETAWYDSYRRYPFFAARIDELAGRFAPNGQKVLIAGCGWGFLVEMALTAGYDAWGCDASSYATGKAPSVLTPSAAARVITGDVLSRASLNAVRSAAGLTGNQRFTVVVTEDLLPCLSDAEVNAALVELRRISTANLLHIVTCIRLDWWPGANDAEKRARDLATRKATMNWKTLAEWSAILAPPDVVIDSQDVQ